MLLHKIIKFMLTISTIINKQTKLLLLLRLLLAYILQNNIICLSKLFFFYKCFSTFSTKLTFNPVLSSSTKSSLTTPCSRIAAKRLKR